jgi:hypothetical protein
VLNDGGPLQASCPLSKVGFVPTQEVMLRRSEGPQSALHVECRTAMGQ